MHVTNHLLFVDDLKILTEDECELQAMMNETKAFFLTIGFKINKSKSANNTAECAEDATLLVGPSTYKYLGIIETSSSTVSSESFEKVRNEILN